MKAATSVMKRGLIARSTETAATTAVTIAGMAATSEKRTTTRLCSRAPARAARRAALSAATSIEMRTIRMTTTRPSPPNRVMTTMSVGMMGVKPAKTRNVASARTKAAPTTITPMRPVGRLSSRRAVPRRSIVVVAVKSLNRKPPNSPMANLFSASVAKLQRCCSTATPHRKLATPRRLRSRIFLRRVLRFNPRISAALI